MLTIVMAKPMQLTMVSAVPFDSAGALCATMLENKGEAAMTTKPQKRRKTVNTPPELLKNNSGDIRQHNPEANKAIPAVRLAPSLSEI